MSEPALNQSLAMAAAAAAAAAAAHQQQHHPQQPAQAQQQPRQESRRTPGSTGDISGADDPDVQLRPQPAFMHHVSMSPSPSLSMAAHQQHQLRHHHHHDHHQQPQPVQQSPQSQQHPRQQRQAGGLAGFSGVDQHGGTDAAHAADPRDIDVRFLALLMVEGAPPIQLALALRNGGRAALIRGITACPGGHALVAPRCWIVHDNRAFEVSNPRLIRTDEEVYVTNRGARLTRELFNQHQGKLNRLPLPPDATWSIQAEPPAAGGDSSSSRGMRRPLRVSVRKRKKKTLGTALRLLEHMLLYQDSAVEMTVRALNSTAYEVYVEHVNCLIQQNGLPKSRPQSVAKQTWSQGAVLTAAQAADPQFAMMYRKVATAYAVARAARQAKRQRTSAVVHGGDRDVGGDGVGVGEGDDGEGDGDGDGDGDGEVDATVDAGVVDADHHPDVDQHAVGDAGDDLAVGSDQGDHGGKRVDFFQ